MKPPVSAAQLNNRLKLRYLAFLVSVDEERSISRAAERFAISQPAATKLLREIEDLVGARLFERSRYHVAPTASGQIALNTARRILSEVRQLGEELKALSGGETGRVKIGSLISASTTLLPLSLGRLAERFPRITASISETTEDVLLPALAVGDLDVVLGRLPARRDPKFRMRLLYREEFCIVARPDHPIFSSGGDLARRLSDQNWVLPPVTTMTRVETEQTLIAAGLGAPRVVAESSAVMVNLRLVQSADVLSAMPLTLARTYAAMGTLAMVEGGPEFPKSQIGIVTRAEADLTPAARHFIAAVEEVAAELG
ncbi:LysR substrate-binding domain-containing protein [Roseibacterium sp. SDUM158016]|uniref:LysR substrate-binding domain-containing protein n=1 Tax=Roseicyclus sediminis TaxID=2980997 RepID=UPI0021D34785|nr:LysR substrate-binding domain-containing protein [Roseibacterium sp. SDUM158016]MCU4652756.1 LysR substrate-binding domain-containing protein [Roseibacterium sp. SDUM158016]